MIYIALIQKMFLGTLLMAITFLQSLTGVKVIYIHQQMKAK